MLPVKMNIFHAFLECVFVFQISFASLLPLEGYSTIFFLFFNIG